MKTTQVSEGTLVKVHVRPKSWTFKIEREEEDLLAFCRNAPEKGKVNMELLKELSRLLERDVKLISGFTSREKILLVKDTKPEELERLFQNLLR